MNKMKIDIVVIQIGKICSFGGLCEYYTTRGGCSFNGYCKFQC